ncbi:MAG: hypothetical protein ACI4RM_07335 [Ruminococcus sp.]
MKKFLSILLSVVLLASFILTGCSSQRAQKSVDDSQVQYDDNYNNDYADDYDDDDSSDDAENDEYYECGNCNGEGETKCSWCNGTGIMGSGSTTWSCPNCGGDGVGECIICDGAGVRKRAKSSTGGNAGGNAGGNGGGIGNNTPIFDDYGNQGGTQCPKCNGTGKVICTFCNGTGVTGKTQFAPNYGMGGNDSYQVQTTCYNCHGAKQVDCIMCLGDGLV